MLCVWVKLSSASSSPSGNALVVVPIILQPQFCNHKVIEKLTNQPTIANPDQECPNTIQIEYPAITNEIEIKNEESIKHGLGSNYLFIYLFGHC